MDLELILSVLEPYHITDSRGAGAFSADRLLLYERGAEDLPGTVYVARGAETAGRYRESLLVCIGPCAAEADRVIELEEADLITVFNALARQKNRLDELHRTLSRLQTDEEIVETAGSILNKPFFYFDENYRIRAITHHVEFEHDTEWEYMLRNGILSPESAMQMQRYGEFDLLADTREPVIYRSEFFPFPAIVTNLYRNDQFVGRLNMLCVGEEPSAVLTAACDVIATHLKRISDREGPGPAGTPLLGMLRDLLRGVRLSEALINDRLRERPAWKTGHFRVYRIALQESRDSRVGAHLTSVLGSMFGGDAFLALEHANAPLLLAHAAREEDFADVTSEVGTFLTLEGLQAGMSNSFANLNDLSDALDQAEAALRLGEGEPIRDYRGCMLQHLLSYIPEDRKPMLIHPDIRLLEAADGERGPLTETLRVYLENDRNLTRTAEEMFVHKNTLLYRLKHIREIIRTDLDDPEERLMLQLSFLLMGGRAHGGGR